LTLPADNLTERDKGRLQGLIEGEGSLHARIFRRDLALPREEREYRQNNARPAFSFRMYDLEPVIFVAKAFQIRTWYVKPYPSVAEWELEKVLEIAKWIIKNCSPHTRIYRQAKLILEIFSPQAPSIPLTPKEAKELDKIHGEKRLEKLREIAKRKGIISPYKPAHSIT